MHGLVNVNIKASSLDAEIITELILNGDAYRIAAKKRAWAERNCRLFEKIFGTGSGGISYYKWLPIHINKPWQLVEKELMERGIRVYHSRRFTVAADREESWLRVSLCSAGTGKKLEQGLNVLKKYLSESEG